MDMRADDRNTDQPNALKVWSTILNRLSAQMARDYWAHAEAFGRYVDDITRARTFTTYDEARRSYGQRVLTLLEQSASGYASLWEIERYPNRRLDEGRSNDTPTASAVVVHDATPPTVRGAVSGNKIADVSAPALTEAGQRRADSALAKAAADALLDSVRAKAAAAEVSAPPSKKHRARKAAPKVDQHAVGASAPKKPHKRARRPSKGAPPLNPEMDPSSAT